MMVHFVQLTDNEVSVKHTSSLYIEEGEGKVEPPVES
jgi:hypothetical protein